MLPFQVFSLIKYLRAISFSKKISNYIVFSLFLLFCKMFPSLSSFPLFMKNWIYPLCCITVPCRGNQLQHRCILQWSQGSWWTGRVSWAMKTSGKCRHLPRAGSSQELEQLTGTGVMLTIPHSKKTKSNSGKHQQPGALPPCWGNTARCVSQGMAWHYAQEGEQGGQLFQGMTFHWPIEETWNIHNAATGYCSVTPAQVKGTYPT